MKEAGIVFFFEENDIDVWSGRNIDLDAWNYNCKIGGFNKAIIINRTNQVLNSFDIDMDIQILSEFPTLSGTVVQMVIPSETENSISIWDYDHQADWYVFGPANGWHGNLFADDFIYIPQETNTTLHSIFIGAVTAFSRVRTLKNL